MLTQIRAYRTPIATFLTTLMVIWQIGQPLQGAVVYWDINGTTAGASGSGAATGDWDGTNTFFNTDSTGAGGGAIAAWSGGDTLVFGAGTNATNLYTVTVSGTQSIGGLTFEEGLVTLTGGILQMAANSDFNVAGGLTATINSAIDGGFNLSKLGDGTLVLGGTNTYTGNTLINAGILLISTDANLGAAPGSVVADSMNFTGNSTLRLTGTGSPTINSNRGITLNTGVSGTVQVVDASNTVTYGGIVTGIAGATFKKTGAGMLDLQGNSTAAFLGALNVDGGTLKLSGNGEMAGTSGVTISNRGTLTLDNSGTLNTNRTAGAITSSGGTINFIGNAAATTETLGALTLNAGALTITSTTGGGGNTLTIPSITRSVAGGTLYLNSDATSSVVLATAPALVNSVLSYAIANNGSLISFANYPTSGGSNQTVVPLALASHNQGAETTWAAGNNVRPLADVTNAASRNLHTLTLDSGIDILGPAGDRNLTLTGGILQTGGVSLVATGATATNGTNFLFGTNEALFHILGSLQLNRGSDNNNLVGTGGFTKTGAGTLILNGVSTLTGAFHINEGITELRGATALMTTAATINLNGGTLRLSNDAGTTYTGNILVNADSTIQVDRVTAAATATTHQLGTLSIGGGRTLSVNSNDITSGTAYGFTAGALTLTSGGATFDVANNGAGTGTMIVTSVNGAFPLVKTGAGDFLNNSVSAGYTAPVEIQAGRLGWGGSTGTVTESQTFYGAGGLIKSGVVVVNLTGANTFTGGVTVNGGTLGFSTVSNNGGAASNLGQGTDGISLGGGTLSFIGGASQATNRAITITAASTLSANGTSGATITYNGAISAGTIGLTLAGTAGSVGIIAGGITQTDDAADATINGGTWRHQTGTSRIGDDTTLTGANSILHLDSGLLQVRDDFTVTAGANLNLNAAGVLSFSTATLSADASLRATGGATITLGANNAVVLTDFDGLRIGSDAAGVGTLAMATFNQSVTDFILGNRNLDRSGLVTGSGILTATSNIDLYGGTVNAKLAVSGAITVDKISMNTVTLSGDNSGITSTGDTNVNEGTLILDYSSNTATKVGASSSLDMLGANLILNGNSGSAVTQSVVGLKLDGGGSNVITLNTAGGQDLVLNLNAITRVVNAQDGTMRFVLPSGTQSITNGITTDTLNTLGTGANAILGGWATVNDGTGVFFARNATNAADGNILAAATTLQDAIGSWVAGDNVSDNTLGFSGSMDGISLNSLRFNANAASAVAINSGGVLGVNSGGILMTSAAATGAHAISGGRLVAGGQELIFTQDSAVGLEVSSTITGNTALTKSGNGTLTLSGGNNFTGTLTIQSGTVTASGGNAIGDTAGVLMGDERTNELQLTANETIGALSGGSVNTGQAAGNVNLGSNTLTINQTVAGTFAGFFTGSGTLIKSGSATLTVSGTTTTSFTGPVIINQGILVLSANTGILSSAASFTINAGGELLVDNNNATDADSIGNGIGITLNNTFSTNGLFVRTNQGNTKTEDVGAVLLGAGHNTITSHGSATNAISDLIMDGLTTSNHATALVRGNALGAGTGTRGNIRASVAVGNTALNAAEVGGAGAAGTTTISIIPWLVGDLSQTGVGTSFVTNVDATVGLRPLNTTTEYILNSAAPATGTNNVRYTATNAITTPAAINSLVLDSASAIALTGSATSMEITSGAILATGAGAHSIGTITGLTTGGGRDYTIYTTTAAGSLTISTSLSSAVPLVKSGAGTLFLSSATANAFTDLYLNHGVVQASAVDQTGTGVFNFSGGTLKFGAAFDPSVKPDTTARTINFNSGGGTFDTNGLAITLANTLGSGSGTFTKTGNGNLTLNAASAHTGATAITAGTVTLGANQAIGTGALTVSGATTVLAMGAFNATVAGLTLTTAGVSITGSGTLTVNGDAIINNTSSIAPILGGTMNLLNPGGGALTLSNAANTFTGYTWVQSGGVSVLNLADAGSASGLGAPVAGDNAAIRLGSTTTAGILTITATTGTGGTTDRPFWLTGTTGGGTIDNDGTGALILNADIKSMEYGAKTLTLQGATTGFNNVLNGIIEQAVGTVALTKAEAGTWVLANTTSPSTYTGVNTITLGTLQVNRATGGLGDSTAVNAIDLNGGVLSLRNDGAGNNGTIIYGSASNATGYNVRLSATSTINVDNLTANTGNTIQLGPLTQAAAAVRTLNVTGANGYTLTLASLGLNPGTGNTTTLNPTTSSIIVTGNVTNPMSGFGTGNFDTIVLDGTSTGNVINGTISDAAGGGFTPVLLGGYTIVTKSNSSTWTLNGSGSTYTGNTNINGGVLIAGTDTSLGNSLINFGGGTLNNQDENRTFANNAAMAGDGTLTGTGNFAFNGNFSNTGAARILNINNTGTTTFGDASTDNFVLAENDQARVLTLNIASTASAIINATLQAGTGTGADGITKTGLGSLTINTVSTYTGATTLDNGTTTFTAAQNLAATTNSLIIGSAAATTTPVTVDFDNVNATFGGALTMNVNSATASTITVDAARTLSIGGNVQIGATTPAVANTVTKLTLNGGGAFNVTTAAAGTFTVGGSTSTTNAQDTTLDLTALASTTINTSTTGTLRVNPSGGTNLSGAKATLLLPTPVVADTVATATITAGTIAVGNAGLFSSQAGQINTIMLGTGLTTLNANTINVGTGSRDIGQIIFGQADGDLIIRAADGTSRATLIAIGTGGASTGTTEATTNNLVDFSSHDADILVTSLNVGNQARIGNLVSEFKFGAGNASLASVLDATNVNIGFRTGTATATSILTNRVNLSGGTVTFGNVGGTGTGVDIGNSTYNQAGAASTIGELNISGGSVTIYNSTSLGAAVRLGSNAAAGGGTVTSSLNLTGGSTILGGHIIRNATSPRTTSTVLLNGASAVLDMGGFNIGTATELITFDVRQGTLQNLGEFNGGANLVKTTSGTLTIGGTNSYTGNNVFQEGTVIAVGGANNRLSTAGLTLGDSTTSAILQLGNGSGASSQTFTSLATSGTGTANAIVNGNAAFATLTVNQSTNTQFEGNIGGTGANQNNLNVIKSGAGTLVVSGAAAVAGAAWTGTTTVNGGDLYIDHKDAFAATSTSLTVADGAEFAVRGSGLTANQVYGFSGAGNVITLGSGAGTAVLGFRIDGTFNTQLALATGQTMTVTTGSMFQTAVYVDDAPTAGQGYILINGADANSLHAGGGTFDFNPVVFNGGSFTYTLTNDTGGGAYDHWVLTPTAQPALADVWWRGDLTGLAQGVWSATLTSGTGFPSNWDDQQASAGATDAQVPPDSGSIVHFSSDAGANFATTLGANLTIQELIFHSGASAISVDGNSGLYTLTLGNTVDVSGITLQSGAQSVSITADVALAQAQSFNVSGTGGGTLTFSRGISGTGPLGINSNGSSTGTMILSGANGLATYSGPTRLVDGHLILEGGASNRLPTTTALTIGDATRDAVLQLGDAANGASNTTIGTLNRNQATLAGTSAAATNGSAGPTTITLTPANAAQVAVGETLGGTGVPGGVTVTAVDYLTGVVTVSAWTAATDVAADQNFTFNASSLTTNSIVGGGATASILTIVQGSAGTFNGIIGGGGTNENQVGITKQGGATLVLNGANTYTGATTVNNGILQLGSSGGINGSASLTVNANAGVTATFDNNGRTTVLAGGITLGGADSSATPVIANTTAGGSITLGGNVVYDATNNPLGGSIAVPLNLGTASRTFTANNSATAATDLTITGAVTSTSGNVGANGIGLTLDGAGNGLLTATVTLVNGTTDGASADFFKTGAGAWTIQNTLSAGDDIQVTGGTLTVSGAGSLTWNGTGSTSQDLVIQTGTGVILNLDVADAVVGNTGTNVIYVRGGNTLNLNATNAIGAGVERINLGDNNNGIGNLVLASGTTNSIGILDLGHDSAGEQGHVSGTGTLNVITTLTLDNGTASANLSGAAATTKTFNTIYTLSGNNLLTGTTSILENTLVADHTTNAGTNTKIGTGNFSIGSTTHNQVRAIYSQIGHATAASRQDVANFTVVGGPTQVNLTGTAGVDNILRITGSLLRTGGTVHFTLADANKKLQYSGSTTNTNGMLPAWMTLNRADFLTISENGVVDNLVAATYTTQNNPANWGANQNITNDAAFSGTVDADCNTINSLRFNAAAASTVTIGTGNTLIVSSGGIMATAAVGNNASVITGGNLVSGAGEFFFHQNNTANTLSIESRLLFSPVITKTGAGTLILSGTNNQTGAIFIEEGILRLSGGSAISDTSGVTIRSTGGTSNAGIELAANQTETIGTLTASTIAATIILNTGSTLTIVQGGAQTMAGVISGAGNLVKGGGSTLTLTGTSTMTGTVTINGGNLTMSGAAGTMATATTFTLNAAELLNDQNDATTRSRIGDAADIILNNTAGTNGLFLRTDQGDGNTENIGDIRIGAGHNVVTAFASVAAGIATLQADTLTRLNVASQNHGTALVRGNNLGSTATQRGIIAFDSGAAQTTINGFEVGGGGAATSTNISIIPWLVGHLSETGLGNSFVTNVDSTSGLRPLASTEYINDSTAITGTLTDNIRYTATAAITATPTAINSLVFDSGTAIALTGSASSMEITSGAILAAGNANHSIGTITALTTGASRDYTIYNTGTGTFTINSALTSAVALVKSGAGTLSLTNTGNLFTDVYLNQGTLLFDDLDKVNGTTGTLNFFGGGVRVAAGFADDLSTKSWNINTGGGTIDVSLVTAGTTFANGIDDTTVSSSDTINIATRSSATGAIGRLTIQGSSTFTGTTIINHTGISSTVASVILNGNSDAINGNLQIGHLTSGTNDVVVHLGASDQIVDTATLSFRGVAGAYAYFKLLGFNETVAGISDTTASGVIENRETETVSASGTLTLNSTSDFSFNGFLRDVNTGVADANKLILVKQGTGTQTLSGGQIRHSGTTTISGGALTLTDVSNWQSAITNNATLNLNQTADRTHSNTISGSGTVVKLGTAKVTLTGANDYSGVTNIQQGTLSISASNNLGNASTTNDVRIANLATLEVTADVNLSVNRALMLSGTGGRVNVTGTNTLTVSGVVEGDECCGLVKEGTGNMVLTNATNTWAGTTAVNEGILQVGSAGVGSTGAGQISVASGATLAGSGTVSGSVILGSGAVLQAGDVTTVGTAATTTTTNATLTFTPAFTAASGSEIRLGITGSTNLTIDPFFGGTESSPNEIGSVGYNAFIAGFENSAAGNHDKLVFVNDFNFAAGSEIVVTPVSFTAQKGQIFNLIDWTGINGFVTGDNFRNGSADGGTTDDLDLPTLTGDLLWDVSFFQTHGIIVVVPEPSRTLFLMLGLLGLMLRRRRRQI